VPDGRAVVQATEVERASGVRAIRQFAPAELQERGGVTELVEAVLLLRVGPPRGIPVRDRFAVVFVGSGFATVFTLGYYSHLLEPEVTTLGHGDRCQNKLWKPPIQKDLHYCLLGYLDDKKCCDL
jgi:hypothetical protein